MAFVPCVLRPRYYSGGPSASVPDPLLLPELSKLSFSPLPFYPPWLPISVGPIPSWARPFFWGPLPGRPTPPPLTAPWTYIRRGRNRSDPFPPPREERGSEPRHARIWPHSVFPPPPASCRLIIRRLGRHLTDTTRKNTPFGFGFVYIFSCPHRRRFSRVLVRSPSLPRDPLIYTPH